MSDSKAAGGEDAGAVSVQAWQQGLAEALGESHPEEEAEDLAASFALRAPASYRDQTPPAEAAFDVLELAELSGGRIGQAAATSAQGPQDGRPQVASSFAAFGGSHRLAVRPSADPSCTFRIRRYGQGTIELTRFLPVLESFGLVVVEAVPHRIAPGREGPPELHIDDIGLRTEAPQGIEALRFVPQVHGPRLVAALEAVARGETEVDSLNRLVTVAGLDWRQVALLRTYLRYRLQTGTTGNAWAMADALVSFPDVSRSLVGYFQARFDPAVQRDDSGAGPEEAVERARCVAALELVPHLEQDRVLRGFLQMIDATVRTNYFQSRSISDEEERQDIYEALPSDGAGGEQPLAGRATIVLKFDSSAVPDLPPPRPKLESFVHGPRLEGVHLRAGMVARGGVRWSERPADFRTEILDLAFAQVKKNAIIVATGAKGGFVCRSDAARWGDLATNSRSAGVAAEPGPADVRAAYEVFIRSLLAITDNVSGGVTTTPPGVVARDGPDPYLVVAADKGTATFSDLANSISESCGFWLGDAFASGGSRGYDHKKLGITARGAWAAVNRHFRQLGIDVRKDSITVVGVGDMSGDVFGNGMLQSDRIRLVAAFDHRHVFVDPDPDPAVSFAERERLAGLERSSWADYRQDLISAGGGVWTRDAKSIQLSAAARRALGVEVAELSPPELISAILAAPADLLWFGGIGTYIKAPGEADADVADHANDGVRITSDRVRARVVAEGANLGVTQRARIRYSRRGGRINTDFIDNAAGVATSDREVNLKILLALAIEEGRLDPGDRDGYLGRSTDEVISEVLRQVDHSVAALDRAVTASAREPDAFAAFLESLEQTGTLNRAVEALPEEEELRVRREAGGGFIRPELAVLLAYSKSDLVSAIEPSIAELPASGHPYLDGVVPYFPQAIRQDFEDLIPRHRLFCQLAATDVAGEIVDQLGIVWAHETAAEMGRSLPDVAAAFWAAGQVIEAGEMWAELERAASSLTADAEGALHGAVADSVIRLARSYLGRPGAVDVRELVASDSATARQIEGYRATEAGRPVVERLVEMGVPEEVAASFSRATWRAEVGDVRPVVAATGRDVSEVLEAMDGIDRAAATDLIRGGVAAATAAVPPPARLTMWLARSILDDLAGWRRAVAVKVLGPLERKRVGRSGPARLPPSEAVAVWQADQQEALAGTVGMLASPSPSGSEALHTAVLVVRRLQRTIL